MQIRTEELIVTIAHDHQARLHSCQLPAEDFDFNPRA
jgi:hypothetical protein